MIRESCGVRREFNVQAGLLSAITDLVVSCFETGKLLGINCLIGPFGGKTKNLILFVSNTLDPVTPTISKFIDTAQSFG